MTQPEYVPVTLSDRVRDEDKLPPHGGWRATRPADAAVPLPPDGIRMGHPGPDQGFALRLATRFTGRLRLEPGESVDDAVAGATAVAMKRSGLYGRAPVVFDLEHAFTLWGFLGEPPRDLVEHRRAVFAGAAHHYWVQRDIADMVPEETLRLTPAQVSERLSGWRSLLAVPVRPTG